MCSRIEAYFSLGHYVPWSIHIELLSKDIELLIVSWKMQFIRNCGGTFLWSDLEVRVELLQVLYLSKQISNAHQEEYFIEHVVHLSKHGHTSCLKVTHFYPYWKIIRLCAALSRTCIAVPNHIRCDIRVDFFLCLFLMRN